MPSLPANNKLKGRIGSNALEGFGAFNGPSDRVQEWMGAFRRSRKSERGLGVRGFEINSGPRAPLSAKTQLDGLRLGVRLTQVQHGQQNTRRLMELLI